MKHFSFFFLLIFYSCSGIKSHKQEMIKKFENSVYPEVFNSFSMDEDFIKNSLSQNILFPEAMYVSNYCGVFIEYKYNNVDYENIMDSFETKKLSETRLDDPCNLYFPFKEERPNCSNQYYPVPDIENQFSELRDKISKGKYIVLNYKLGKFLKDESQLKGDTHGYSNGIIANKDEKKVIYWIMIW